MRLGGMLSLNLTPYREDTGWPPWAAGRMRAVRRVDLYGSLRAAHRANIATMQVMEKV